MIQITQIARTAIFKIIEEEGGWVYTDHAVDKDRGTYAGVRYKVFKEYYVNTGPIYEDIIMTPLIYKDMADSGLIKDIIIDIYYARYYQKLNINHLPDVLKMPVFSCGVNTGPRRAGIILQRTVNEILRNYETAYDKQLSHYIEVDGFIGDITISTIQDIFYHQLCFIHNADTPLSIDTKTVALVNMDKFRNTFIKNWIKRYVNITVDEPEYTVFLSGWFSRATKYWVL